MNATQSIPFIKASACGNDFLLIDGAFAPLDPAAFTRRICDRHLGVGADGVEWIFPHFSADAEARLINADGSAAEISGNGTRCVAAHLCSGSNKDRISVLTGAGAKICSLISRSHSEFEFEMEMGQATVDPELVLNIKGKEVRGVPVSTGNPHYVVFVSEFPANWQSLAAEIQRQPQFPQGVNVEFVIPQGKREARVLFFERGAGETQSSGTGSCASAVASIATGRADSTVKIHAPGGMQTVRKEGGNIFLRGPARLVCRGEFFLS